MGFTAFALAHVTFAVATKDERRSLFNRDTFADKPLLVAIGASLAVIVLTTTFGPLQRLLETTDLDLGQWLVCIGGALLVVALSELRKALVRRPLDDDGTDEAPAAPAIGELHPAG
jgi:Ca2+-transporting ATPase